MTRDHARVLLDNTLHRALPSVNAKAIDAFERSCDSLEKIGHPIDYCLVTALCNALEVAMSYVPPIYQHPSDPGKAFSPAMVYRSDEQGLCGPRFASPDDGITPYLAQSAEALQADAIDPERKRARNANGGFAR